jgi:tRNA dimethylallyltransferase
MIDAFFLAGPTAVGKTDLAVAVAEACNGEIVGADAFQIYAGLDLLTAKPAPELRVRVPHHLIGEIPLTRLFDVAQYRAEAGRRIADIRARGRVPIVCGGTGLYFRALTRGLAELPPADPALRAELESTPLDELVRRLAELDPASAQQIDTKNPRRVIRALEVCLLSGQRFSTFRAEWKATPPTIPGVFLTRDRAELHTRIDQRTEAMFAAGVEDEVRAAGEIGPTAAQTLGWREIRKLLAGEMSRADCLAAIQQATRRYAKRQLTWFRREPFAATANLSTLADLAPLVRQLAEQAAAVRP